MIMRARVDTTGHLLWLSLWWWLDCVERELRTPECEPTD